MGMCIDPAEKGIAGNSQQYQEIDCHIEIIGNCRRRNESTASLECIGQGRKIHAAANIRTGHHGRDFGESRYERPQQPGSQDGSTDRTDRPDQKNKEQPSRFPPYFLQICLQQKERDSQWHSIAPDDIVIKGRTRRNNPRINQNQGHDQRDDGTGNPGSPGIFLFQIDETATAPHIIVMSIHVFCELTKVAIQNPPYR